MSFCNIEYSIERTDKISLEKKKKYYTLVIEPITPDMAIILINIRKDKIGELIKLLKEVK